MASKLKSKVLSNKHEEIAYGDLPTPKEVELSKELMELKESKISTEKHLRQCIASLEYKLHLADKEKEDLSSRLIGTRREQALVQQQAIIAEQDVWKAKLRDLAAILEHEKKEKAAQENWKNRFEKATKAVNTMDPVQLTLAKVGQQVACLQGCWSGDIVQYGVVPFFSQILRQSANDLVIGPVLIALVHLSLFSSTSVNVSDFMVKAGILPPLICLLESNENPAILSETLKLLGSIALYPGNKPVVAAKKGVKSIVRLLNAAIDSDVQAAAKTDHVVEAALVALVNLTNDSGIIRTQLASLGAIEIVCGILNESINVQICTQCGKLFTNLAYNHFMNQGKIVSAQGDGFLVLKLIWTEATDEMQAACFLALSNLAHHEVNQEAIGYSKAIPAAVKAIVERTDPWLLFAATTVLGSLQYKCIMNKNRVQHQRGVEALLYLITQPERYGSDARVLASVCRAIASFSVTVGNRRIIEEMNGVRPIVQFCADARQREVIQCSAMAVAALVPSEGTKDMRMREGSLILVELEDGLAALTRAERFGFDANAPTWLSEALHTMRSVPPNLKPYQESDWYGEDCKDERRDEIAPLVEFYERGSLSIEVVTDINPDEECVDFRDGNQDSQKAKMNL